MLFYGKLENNDIINCLRLIYQPKRKEWKDITILNNNVFQKFKENKIEWHKKESEEIKKKIK